MKEFSKYFRIYRQIAVMNFTAFIAYQVNFLSSVISTIVWSCFHFIAILLLTSGSKYIYGWTRNEILLLTATFSLFWGIFHVLFLTSFSRFAIIFDQGELDGILLKPINAQFLLSISRINYANIIRFLLGLIVLLYIIITSHLYVSFAHILFFLCLLTISTVLMYSVWFIFSTLHIWFYRLTNLRHTLMYLSGIGRYPIDMFESTIFFVLLFPFISFISIPTKVLVHKLQYEDIFIFASVTLLLFTCSKLFWQFSLKYYTSVGS